MDREKPISALLIDDHPIVLNGLKSLLDDGVRIKVIADASNGLEALLILESNHVDLVISDISMPEMDGIEFTKQLKIRQPDTKVMLLTAHNEKEILKRALFSGAEACLLKNTSKKELLIAIDKVMDNGYYYCDNLLEIAKNFYQEPELYIEDNVKLSERETEVLELLLHGLSNKEVAEKLSISYHTVTSHRKNTMKKTKSRNISGLYNYAKRNKLFPALFKNT